MKLVTHNFCTQTDIIPSFLLIQEDLNERFIDQVVQGVKKLINESTLEAKLYSFFLNDATFDSVQLYLEYRLEVPRTEINFC